MGGGKLSTSSSSSDDRLCLDNDSQLSEVLRLEFEDNYENIPNRCHIGELDETHDQISPNPVEFDQQLRRRMRQNAYKQVIKSYRDSSARTQSLDEAKRMILSYTPGSWMEEEDVNTSDYSLPKRATLLLVGPKGSGKSSLINRISRVFENEKSASARAQVSTNSLLDGGGTLYLQGYTVPRGSNSSFCLFDTCGLTNNLSGNEDLLRHWMTEGVCNGELANRNLHSSTKRTLLGCSSQDHYSVHGQPRKVNFVIFVISAPSILGAVDSDNEEDKCDMEILARSFNSPYLSFRDDKPVIVITHGEFLSLEERANVRIRLGDLLGVPAATQIFDIPESNDPSTELAIVDMLKYSLEHADKYLLTQTSADRGLMSALFASNKFFQMPHLILIPLFLIILTWATIGATLHSWPTNLCGLQSSSHLDQVGLRSGLILGYQRCRFNATPYNDPGLGFNDYKHHYEQPSTSSTDHQDPQSKSDDHQYVSQLSNHDNLSSKSKKFKSPDRHHQRRNHKHWKKEKKNRPRGHCKKTWIEPEINWEARKRLWLVED